MEGHRFQAGDGTPLFLLFFVEEERFAMDVTKVERVLRAAEVTRLSAASEIVRGLINIAGTIIPVIDMRRRLGLPDREMELSDRLILTRAAGKPLALLVDKVEGVVALSAQSVSGGDQAASWAAAASAATDVGGRIVLIQNTDTLVSADTMSQLDRAGRKDAND